MAPGFDPLLQCLWRGHDADRPARRSADLLRARDQRHRDRHVVRDRRAGRVAAARSTPAKVASSTRRCSRARSPGCGSPLDSLSASPATCRKRHGAGSGVLTPVPDFRDRRPADLHRRRQRPAVRETGACDGPCPEWADDPRFADGRQRAANRAALVAVMQPVLSDSHAPGLAGHPRRGRRAGRAGQRHRRPCRIRAIAGDGHDAHAARQRRARRRPADHLRPPTPASAPPIRPKLGEHNAEILGSTGETRCLTPSTAPAAIRTN